MIYNEKSVFLAVNVTWRWLNNVCGVYRFPCFFSVSRVWEISSDIGSCFPLAGGLCKLYANAGGKWPLQHRPFLVQYKKQANPLLSMHNYTSLVISRNDKNKQLTSKPMQTRINCEKYTFCIIKSLEHLKNSKNGPGFYLGLELTIRVIKSKIHLVRR